MRYTLCLAFFLAGCMSNQRIETLTPQQREAVLHVQILEKPPSGEYDSLGVVSGLSCNRNKFQAPKISEDEAMQGLRIEATKRGATAVMNTFCQTNSDTDWRNNCWASVKCVGDAIKVH